MIIGLATLGRAIVAGRAIRQSRGVVKADQGPIFRYMAIGASPRRGDVVGRHPGRV